MASKKTISTANIDSTDLEAIARVRPNLLLCGPADAVNTTLATLRPSLQPPVYKWVHNTHQSLPHEFTGTLIFEHAASAHSEQQRSLLDWLGERTGRVQVISTTEEPLFALVQEGVFLDRLFYQLNTLYLELGCPD